MSNPLRGLWRGLRGRAAGGGEGPTDPFLEALDRHRALVARRRAGEGLVDDVRRRLLDEWRERQALASGIYLGYRQQAALAAYCADRATTDATAALPPGYGFVATILCPVRGEPVPAYPADADSLILVAWDRDSAWTA